MRLYLFLRHWIACARLRESAFTCALSDIQPIRDSFYADTCGIQIFDAINETFKSHEIRIPFAKNHLFPLNCISHILRVIANIKMFWIHACFVIARMQDEFPFRNFAAMKNP